MTDQKPRIKRINKVKADKLSLENINKMMKKLKSKNKGLRSYGNEATF